MDQDQKKDEEDAIFQYASSKDKINVTLERDNNNQEEKNDVIETFSNNKSYGKDIMLVDVSGGITDVSGKDQDKVIWYEDQEQQENGEEQDIVICY